ncbi:hypothetical protein BT69DRAFT_342167 [Atractiella rhizophila]|nr:hypothetical protein BT69DRAFT_342167 [Atractiella rhizophila]
MMSTSCSACASRQKPCLPSAQGEPCVLCAKEGSICSFTRKASKQTRHHLNIESVRGRWDLQQLSETPYSSSKDLEASFRKEEARAPHFSLGSGH